MWKSWGLSLILSAERYPTIADRAGDRWLRILLVLEILGEPHLGRALHPGALHC